MNTLSALNTLNTTPSVLATHAELEELNLNIARDLGTTNFLFEAQNFLMKDGSVMSKCPNGSFILNDSTPPIIIINGVHSTPEAFVEHLATVGVTYEQNNRGHHIAKVKDCVHLIRSKYDQQIHKLRWSVKASAPRGKINLYNEDYDVVESRVFNEKTWEVDLIEMLVTMEDLIAKEVK